MPEPSHPSFIEAFRPAPLISFSEASSKSPERMFFDRDPAGGGVSTTRFEKGFTPPNNILRLRVRWFVD